MQDSDFNIPCVKSLLDDLEQKKLTKEQVDELIKLLYS